MFIWHFCLAPFRINIAAHNAQQVGNPLTLECNVIEEMSVGNNLLEIIWTTSSDITLKRTVITAIEVNNSFVYTDSYTISQLNTTDHGRVIQCIANSTDPPVIDSHRFMLNLTGKFKERWIFSRNIANFFIKNLYVLVCMFTTHNKIR